MLAKLNKVKRSRQEKQQNTLVRIGNMAKVATNCTKRKETEKKI